MNKSVERRDRHDPSEKHDYLSIQHLERYHFACELLKPGMKVLDIACGIGYGTYALLKHGCEVIGADIDNGILEKAKKKWNHRDFRYADVLNLPYEEEEFDAVVSFETIEHVTDGVRFLSEMNRVLKPGGIFICSTPNIKYTAHPPFHVKEYKPGEFFCLVESYFNDVRRYGQYFKPKDRIQDLLRWQFRDKLVKLVELLKLKDLIKALLGRGEMSARENAVSALEVDNKRNRVYNKASITGRSYYSVKPLKGVRLLRIMLVAGKK